MTKVKTSEPSIDQRLPRTLPARLISPACWTLKAGKISRKAAITLARIVSPKLLPPLIVPPAWIVAW